MQRTYFLVLGAIALHFVTTSSASISIANNHNNSASDLNALRAFKATIFDRQRIIPTNWSTSSSVCNWIGITCNARHHRVAAIDLSYMGIVGTIPPQLGNLSFLVRLNVMNNSFHEHLPTELSHRLTYINLEGNAFEGEPPSWLGGLTALQYSFRDNGFSEEFSALPKLTVLDIQHNQLVGPLPWDLFNLSSLQIIGFTNNSLWGYLPAHICNYLPQLQALYLSLNNFEGEIPSGIGECSRLQVLSLSSNKFRGHIPKGVWNLTTLTQIHLGGTDLTGKLPTSLCFEKFLLDISNDPFFLHSLFINEMFEILSHRNIDWISKSIVKPLTCYTNGLAGLMSRPGLMTMPNTQFCLISLEFRNTYMLYKYNYAMPLIIFIIML
ncbi:unnamed protein product [Coffea canephora]|uniref:Leucine-rich repeat-containing N-terminal plant-type domain-containing protein n=1 Tax=Coffea canephora TaxID=49390 RepID=A0A068URG5_COFCA|nr:unnamed protein product [Coffea canephora]